MRHVSEGTLRRLIDEPLAIPDQLADHVMTCTRCQSVRERIAVDASIAHASIARPQLMPDVDAAWADLVRRAGVDRSSPPAPRRAHQVLGRTVSTGVAVAAVGTLAAGAVAAATLTTVFAPDQVAPGPNLSLSSIQTFAEDLGLSGLVSRSSSSVSRNGRVTTTPAAPSTRDWRDGTIGPLVVGGEEHVASLQQAETETGLSLHVPAALPSGVSGPPTFAVEKQVREEVTFDSRAGSLAGSTLTVSFGPVVVAAYGGGLGLGHVSDVPSFAVVAMERPSATSNGATTSELESFLLAQPGIPSDLARQIRLLGNLQTTLPVPVPPGATESSTTVAGDQAVEVALPSAGVSAVVWEDSGGVIHTVGGFVNENDALGVARQLG